MKLTIGAKLYIIVLTMFVANTVVFLLFQHNREKQYKIEMLDNKLAQMNDDVHSSMMWQYDTVNAANIIRQNTEKIRLTIIKGDGNVIYDSDVDRYDTLPDHRHRTEVANALKNGHGYNINRQSQTTKHDYFYSATYYKDKDIIIRTASPYDMGLIETLKTDRNYIWIAISTLVLLTMLLLPFIHKLSRNIRNLKSFAHKADNGDTVKTEEIAQFADDELGEISEHIIKLYIKLQNTRKEQEHLKRELTQNAAHELKTPVASIQGYLETLTSQYDRMDETTRKRFLDKCYVQSERLSNLVQDISTLNRIDDGKELITFEDVDIAHVVRTVMTESEAQLEKRGMTCKNLLPGSLHIDGSPTMMYSIFRNLLDNAMAYAGENTNVRISATPAGNPDENGNQKYELIFEDNGNGVEPEHLIRLFERFYRVDKGRSRKNGGTGLGLAIVKNAVMLHGGTITAETADGGGLRFRITLTCKG